MSYKEKLDTLLSFITGLFVGGILIFAFSGPNIEQEIKVIENIFTENMLDCQNKDGEYFLLIETDGEISEKCTVFNVKRYGN